MASIMTMSAGDVLMLGATRRVEDDDVTFACSHPCHPRMRSMSSRLQTFRNWARYRLQATPREFAEAGLYFTGVQDQVRCWYCDGDLGNWQVDDDPWVEHTRWYPTCEFVLKNKGQEFVYDLMSIYPEMRRLMLRGSNPTPTASFSTTESSPSFTFETIGQRNHHGNVVTSSRHDDAVTSSRHDDAVTSSRHDDVVASSHHGDHVTSSHRGNVTSSQHDDNVTSSHHDDNVTSSVDPRRELKALQESKKCRKCGGNPVGVLLLPCAHLATCVQCSHELQTCPLCGALCTEKIRTFIS